MKKSILDANQAVAQIAYKLSQVIPVYPITPSSPMAEHSSFLSSKGEKNILGQDVKIIEMQSEAGVAGVLHGALLSRSLSSTFTSSQGLLLMLPNMYKIAGECLPAVIHVASRSIASHALSIFCDHSDVMATRSSGFVMLVSNSVQEAHHMALASHMLALKHNIPVLHFFDGFRTSHQIQKINIFEEKEIKEIIGDCAQNYQNLYQDAQFGTAQNPDVFFQNRQRNALHYKDVDKSLNEVFKTIESYSGKKYTAFEYVGHEKAENILVSIGSSCQTIEEYIEQNPNEKIGLIKVRLYRPFYKDLFINSLPKTTKNLVVLDRCLENQTDSPLFLDVNSAIQSYQKQIKTFSGIYGLGGKEFTPDNVHSIFTLIKKSSLSSKFTVGIIDDIDNTSIPSIDYKQKNTSFQIKIYGLGSDGSVSASKSTIKILGEKFNKQVQGYFEYDSKKSGSLTISHLRLSDNEIKSEYLVTKPNIISINNFSFVNKYDCLAGLQKNGIVVLNTIFDKDEISKILPKTYVQKLQKTNSKLFVIDAQSIARECEIGSKINVIMQASLLKCSRLIKDEEIVENISSWIKENFKIKGEDVVNKNLKALSIAIEKIEEVDVNSLIGKEISKQEKNEYDFYNDIMLPIKNLNGKSIPVSKFNKDGSTPLDTSKFEKRNIASRLPLWIKENCVQCGNCVLACPHSALKAILANEEDIKDKDSFAKAIALNGKLYKVLLSPEDCTGCGVCAKTCPAIKKALEMMGAEEILDKKKREECDTILLPQTTQDLFSKSTAKGLQFEESLFKFSGACAGCGETPYIKILTMLNGSNLMIANATGCSSIYGGTFGSCPYCSDQNGGIFWANSLFEDNAEFGLGLLLGNKFTKNKDKKVWIIGGDGWANDIGFGGLDHIFASGENINILVLDNQSYSNTGGQASKATPTGATVKLADNGKCAYKKNLAQIALNYKDVYVGQIALGGNINHAISTLKQAQEYEGVSIVVAYSPCVNQGMEMSDMMTESRKAVECGFWPLFTFNPESQVLSLDSEINNEKYFDFILGERRFALTKENGKINLLEKQKEQAISDYQRLKNKAKK